MADRPDYAPRLGRNEVLRKEASRAPWSRDPEFLKLQRHWDRVLASTGLKDVEVNPNPTMGGSTSDTSYMWHGAQETMRQASRGALNGGREYFQMVSEWLHLAQWKSVRERMAWAKYTAGDSYAAAAQELKVPVGRMAHQRRQMLEHFGSQVAETMADETWEEL